MFGERIRILRKKQNMTMKELGNVLTLGESTISMYEKGKRAPDYETLKKIAAIFNVSVDYLLGATDNPVPSGQTPKKPTIEEIIVSDSELSEESRKDLLKQLEMFKMRDNLRKYNEEASKEFRPRLN